MFLVMKFVLTSMNKEQLLQVIKEQEGTFLIWEYDDYIFKDIHSEIAELELLNKEKGRSFCDNNASMFSKRRNKKDKVGTKGE